MSNTVLQETPAPNVSGDRSDTYRYENTDVDTADHLAFAMNHIGLSEEGPFVGDFLDDGYHLFCRNPLIEEISSSPFRLHDWAYQTSFRVQQDTTQSIFPLLQQAVMMINGGVRYHEGDKTNGSERTEIPLQADRRMDPAEVVGLRSDVFQELAAIHLGEEVAAALADLVADLDSAAGLMEKAVADLTAEEVSFIRDVPHRYFFPNGKTFQFLTAPTHVQERIVRLSRKIDFRDMNKSAMGAVAAVDRFIRVIKPLVDEKISKGSTGDGNPWEKINLHFPTPRGNVIVRGTGDDDHREAAFLLIDLGGDDTYRFSDSSVAPAPGGISVLIDVGGNDRYLESFESAQGFGCLSLGMLVDLAGDDRYEARKSAQGCGMFGVGILADFAGNDRYRLGAMGQGFGVFGVGILLDQDGDDRYQIGGMGQGTGSTMGFGWLLDRHGNDKYVASPGNDPPGLKMDRWRHVQGAALSVRSSNWKRFPSFTGGFGMLSDGGGDDFYFSENGNCMGSSYFRSIGALVDHGGDDRYLPENGYGIGFAVHLSSAVFIDCDGNDYYHARTHTGGVGSDRSIGLLADYRGDDTYGPTREYLESEIHAIGPEQRGDVMREAGSSDAVGKEMADVSYGAALKPRALGMLIDITGNDRYAARSGGWGESLGGVIPPVRPDQWSHALLIDLGGKDSYAKEGMHDHLLATHYGHAVCYDADRISEKDTKNPLQRFSEFRIGAEKFPPIHSNSITDPVLTDIFDRLQQPDGFVRHKALGELLDRGPEVVADLVTLLKDSRNPYLNISGQEALQAFMVSGGMKSAQAEAFQKLLAAADRDMVVFAARSLGVWRVTSALARLKESAVASDDFLRKHLLWAIGRLGPDAGSIDLLCERIAADASMDCRRTAAEALNELLRSATVDGDREEKIRETWRRAARDSDDVLRYYAAAGLSHFPGDETFKSLHMLTTDQSPYVRRAAARSLIQAGRKSALPVFIETLRFPSIDTFEFYDRDLQKELAFYLGVDFPPEKRFLHETWRNWWNENKNDVHLAENLQIMSRIQAAFVNPSEEEGIRLFTELLRNDPENGMIRARYERFCHEWVNFRILSEANITRGHYLRALRLQRILVELKPEDPAAWVHLAYFHAALGQFHEAAGVCQQALQIHPGHSEIEKLQAHYLEKTELQ